MHAIPSVCPNCGDALRPSDRFCSHCGQDTANHPPTLWEFIHEFATHYVALEGALWRTLKALVFHPGFLTTEYLAGRRMRYVLPLRLLLTLGFVFFLLAKLPHATHASEMEQSAANATPAAASGPEPNGVKIGGLEIMMGDEQVAKQAAGSGQQSVKLEASGLPAWIQSRTDDLGSRWSKNPQAETERLMAKVKAMLPYAVLCSLPFFTAILSLVFWRSGFTYGAHFVFTLHLHAFFYVALSLMLLPLPQWWQWLLIAWMVVYPMLALKRVHGLSWSGAFWRTAVVELLHGVLQVLMFAAVLGIGALTL